MRKNNSKLNFTKNCWVSWFSLGRLNISKCSDWESAQKVRLHHWTVSSTTDKMFKPSYRTDSHGKFSITIGNLQSAIGQIPSFWRCYAGTALWFKLFNVFLHFKHVIGLFTKIYFHFVSYLLCLCGHYRHFELTF